MTKKELHLIDNYLRALGAVKECAKELDFAVERSLDKQFLSRIFKSALRKTKRLTVENNRA